MELFLDPKFWVAAAFIIFVASIYRPVGRFIAAALDKRTHRIHNEIEEAARLRKEAIAILAKHQKTREQTYKTVGEMLDSARQEADTITRKARENLEAELTQKTKMAMEKIAQAQAAVIQEIRDNTVDIVMGAARALIMENLSREVAEELIHKAIKDVNQKFH